MSLNQLFRSQTSPTWKRTQLGDFDTVAGDVVRLPRFNGIHDSGGVVAELALSDHLHPTIVARRSAGGYTHLDLFTLP